MIIQRFLDIANGQIEILKNLIKFHLIKEIFFYKLIQWH